MSSFFIMTKPIHYLSMVFSFLVITSNRPVLSKTLEECGGQAVGSKLGIHPFFIKDSVDEWCIQYTKILECLYSDGDMKLSERTTSATLKFPTDYICQNKEEYKKSQRCFLSPGLKDFIDYKCIRKTNIFECGACAQVSNCIRELVKILEMCTQSDVELLVAIARLYFQPIRKAKGCDVSDTRNSCPSPSFAEYTTTVIPSTSDDVTDGSRVTQKSTHSRSQHTRPTTPNLQGFGKALGRVKTEENGCDGIFGVNIVAIFGAVTLWAFLFADRVL